MRTSSIVLLLPLMLLSLPSIVSAPAPPAASGLVEYCFSPGGNCADRVTYWIGRANSSVHVLIYSFTLSNIRDALIKKSQTMDVKIVLERKNVDEQGSQYSNLKNAGVQIRLDTNKADMHDKVAIIDGHIIVTGSFNWSTAANQYNNENLVVLDNQAWAQAYEQQFQQIWNAATP